MSLPDHAYSDSTDMVKIIVQTVQSQDRVLKELFGHLSKLLGCKQKIIDLLPKIEVALNNIKEADNSVMQMQGKRQREIWHLLKIACVAGESNEVSPEPPLLQTKHPQRPQPLLTGLVDQALHQLCSPSLDTLQGLNVLVMRGPKLNTALEVLPHQSRVQEDDHLPGPVGCTIPDTSQDAVGLLGHLGTLLVHVQASINQIPVALFLRHEFVLQFSDLEHQP
ncbi:inhibitor of nuclear factor kappa-B kinase subunit alpha-like [Anas acuta]|uniref:inhibitor of nuclear factor kappa-B kinase subunit alpha-like n=1 Tax=Anas acuta TaxID=28680 RepID=UPI0035C89277